jgi:hypothetical protein
MRIHTEYLNGKRPFFGIALEISEGFFMTPSEAHGADHFGGDESCT